MAALVAGGAEVAFGLDDVAGCEPLPEQPAIISAAATTAGPAARPANLITPPFPAFA
jgi:hypothetical protein